MFAIIPGRGPVALPRETGADGGSGKSRTAGRSSQRRSRGKATKKVRMKRSDAQARAAARAEAGDRRGAAEDGEDEEGGEGEGDDDDGIVATYRLSVDDLPPFANILVCLDEELPPGTGAFVFLGTPPLETDDWLAVNVLTAERQSVMVRVSGEDCVQLYVEVAHMGPGSVRAARFPPPLGLLKLNENLIRLEAALGSGHPMPELGALLDQREQMASVVELETERRARTVADEMGRFCMDAALERPPQGARFGARMDWAEDMLNEFRQDVILPLRTVPPTAQLPLGLLGSASILLERIADLGLEPPAKKTSQFGTARLGHLRTRLGVYRDMLVARRRRLEEEEDRAYGGPSAAADEDEYYSEEEEVVVVRKVRKRRDGGPRHGRRVTYAPMDDE